MLAAILTYVLGLFIIGIGVAHLSVDWGISLVVILLGVVVFVIGVWHTHDVINGDV